eukprot:3999100-Pleurochrysis_carterae.AAC.1
MKLRSRRGTFSLSKLPAKGACPGKPVGDILRTALVNMSSCCARKAKRQRARLAPHKESKA